MVDVQKLALVLESLGHLVEATLPEVPTHLFLERLVAARDLPEVKKHKLSFEGLQIMANWAKDPSETRPSIGASAKGLTQKGLIQSARIEDAGGWYGGFALTPEGKKLVDVMSPVVYAPVPPEDGIGVHSAEKRAAHKEREKKAAAQLKKKMRENLTPRLNKLMEVKDEKFSREAVADITTRLGSSSERDRFVAKFAQVWDLADQDGVALTDFSPVDVTSLQGAIELADKVARQATQEHVPHAREIRKFTMELKDIAKKRAPVPGDEAL